VIGVAVVSETRFEMTYLLLLRVKQVQDFDSGLLRILVLVVQMKPRTSHLKTNNSVSALGLDKC
jgi:hypothetical protein